MSLVQSAAVLRARAGALAPGILMAFTIAAAARFISEHYGAPAMLFALLLGMAFNFLATDGKCVAGVQVASSQLLKIGVAFLGVRVTLDQISSLGPVLVLVIPVLIIFTIGAGLLFSKLFNRSVSFGLLTGGAVAICGASAALAIAASVLPKSETSQRDTLFTVVAVTSLSTMAMIIYPILFSSLGFTDTQIGVLIGATIHDVAQVVGAGYAVSELAGDTATYVKLLRVACLPIVILLLAAFLRRGAAGGAKTPFPWFAVAFAAILLANSIGLIPSFAAESMDWSSRWLLLGAISALGMKTSLKEMFDLGALHIGVVVAETVFLCAAAIAAISFI
ncbi:MAG: putative sulfate exporter family transporter [Alphaproteobacteria bacterium]|nr:putative sulfate exporter family transporter [Alphaproteobacteria bacterium]